MARDLPILDLEDHRKPEVGTGTRGEGGSGASGFTRAYDKK